MSANGTLTELVKARVDAATYRSVVREAEKTDRSVGAVVRSALREYFARQARAAARDKAARAR